MANWTELLPITLGGGFLSIKLLAAWSHTRCAARGIINGKLAPNNLSPNSVCSEGERADIASLEAKDPETWEELQDAVQSLSGRFIKIEGDYFHAVFKTRLFGFEDDLEARYDRENQCIHLRSSSRVGYSDLGCNGKRVSALKRLVE